MNVFAKLQKCRVMLQSMNLKKSGENKFAGYNYFELQDFLPPINELFLAEGLFGQVSFTAELASLTIINTEKPEEQIVFTSPMATAALKGCHDIQNVGAVETYQRRYLYTMALEIVEHDALDKTTGKPQQNEQNAPQSHAPSRQNTQQAPAQQSRYNVPKTFKAEAYNLRQMHNLEWNELQRIAERVLNRKLGRVSELQDDRDWELIVHELKSFPVPAV
jgi:hypothetical protein